MSECQVFIQIDDNSGTLACWLPEDHDGLHFDEADQVYWQTRFEQEADVDAH